MVYRKFTAVLAAAVVVSLLAGCSASATPSPSAIASTGGSAVPSAPTSAAPSVAPISTAPVSITLWQNYGTEANAPATYAFVKAYEAIHPNVTINVVSQPAANYFALLTAAAISKTGPCLATQWTGLFTLQDKSYLEPLNSYIPLSTLESFKGIQWGSDNFNPASGVYVVPWEMQTYNGFYNKKLFAQAGITTLPKTWADLAVVDQKLKAAGIQPFVYGTGAQGLTAGFYPYYDLSYLMMMIPVADWQKLYDGSLPWTDPTIQAQLDKWVALKANGYTNQDVLNDTQSFQQFLAGKAAMTLEGTWAISAVEKAMGANVGVFLPPFVDQPLNGVVEFPGDGFAMTNYCQNKDVAVDFLKFLADPVAQKIVADEGLIPTVTGSSASDPLANELLGYAANQGYTRYPMIDNVIQGEVQAVGATVLVAAFAGTMSTHAALQKMQDALMALPADRRSASGYK
jgi:ABC-type glycerol-3-phosphate transport system substrate-binding protein